jgi:hypothetical protein
MKGYAFCVILWIAAYLVSCKIIDIFIKAIGISRATFNPLIEIFILQDKFQVPNKYL